MIKNLGQDGNFLTKKDRPRSFIAYQVM